jgi:hypothetical protein
MAAYLLGFTGPLQQQQQQQQQQQNEQLALLQHLLTVEEPYRKVFETLMTPGPVPFNVVRQVRCCILLAECLAGCLRLSGLCRQWLQQGTAAVDDVQQHGVLQKGEFCCYKVCKG